MTRKIFLLLAFTFISLIGLIKLSFPTEGSVQNELLWYCPVCHGQTLFESNHPIAIEILESIEQDKNKGISIEEIKMTLTQQYGDKMFRQNPSPLILPALLGAYWLRNRLSSQKRKSTDEN